MVYIGTPHNFHHLNAKGALLAGKHVLCEKAFTFDLEELDELIKIAREKKLFLMESVACRPIRALLIRIGPCGRDSSPSPSRSKRCCSRASSAKCSDSRPTSPTLSTLTVSETKPNMNQTEQYSNASQPPHHQPRPGRWRSPRHVISLSARLRTELTIFRGPYPSVWAMLLLHRHPDNKERKAPKFINSHQSIYQRTKVDQRSRWLVDWEDVSEAAQVFSRPCVFI